MMRMKTGSVGLSPTNGGVRGFEGEWEWEARPGGMLVQKRLNSDHNRAPAPTVRVRVKYGSNYHEVNISSQATFGELKKTLSEPTGLHHQDQKLLFNKKERDSKAFLDVAGVKDGSKMVLVEDPISKERRYLEMRKNAKVEKASKSVSEISLEIDRLAGKVSALESVISDSEGAKVAEEKDVLDNLIELLMNQLLKLDGIIADGGDVKLQRKMQVRRVQKCVETLDMLKTKSSITSAAAAAAAAAATGSSNIGSQVPHQQQQSPTHQHHQSQRSSANGQISSPDQKKKKKKQQQQQQQQRHSVGHLPAQPVVPQPTPQPSRHSASGSFVITTQWETFDSAPANLQPPSYFNSLSSSRIN